MDGVTRDRMRLSVAEARGLAEHALGKLGYDAEEARIVADHVIDAALCGYEYSGLPKILALHGIEWVISGIFRYSARNV